MHTLSQQNPSFGVVQISIETSAPVTAYPYLYYKLGTIIVPSMTSANQITYATPQSWTSQDIPHPQASWNLHIIAV